MSQVSPLPTTVAMLAARSKLSPSAAALKPSTMMKTSSPLTSSTARVLSPPSALPKHARSS